MRLILLKAVCSDENTQKKAKRYLKIISLKVDNREDILVNIITYTRDAPSTRLLLGTRLISVSANSLKFRVFHIIYFPIFL